MKNETEKNDLKSPVPGGDGYSAPVSQPATSPPSPSASPYIRPLASSPLVVSLLVVLTAAVLVQGALLIGIFLKGSEAGESGKTLSDTGEVSKNEAFTVITPDDPASAPAASPAPIDPFAAMGDAWDPFAEMQRMREEMDRLFEDSFGRFRSMPGLGGGWNSVALPGHAGSSTAISENDEEIVVTVDVPGVDDGAVEIDLEGNQLSIRAEIEQTSEERGADGTLARQSRSSSLFQRSLTLPGNIDSDAMTSEIKDGVLTITIPKANA